MRGSGLTRREAWEKEEEGDEEVDYYFHLL